MQVSAFEAEALSNASTFDPSGMSYDTQRRLKRVGVIPLEQVEENELNAIISQMGSYALAALNLIKKVFNTKPSLCPYKGFRNVHPWGLISSREA